MAFEIASTTLVVELGIILALLLGRQFTLAEFTGGPIKIILLAVLFRLFLHQRLLDATTAQAARAWPGRWRGTPGWTWPSRAGGACGSGSAPGGRSPRCRTSS